MISKEINRKLKQNGESFIVEFKFANEKYIQVLKLIDNKIQYRYYKINNDDITCSFEDMKGMMVELKEMNYKTGDLISISNPYGLKLREEKLVAMVLGISRNRVKKLIDDGAILVSRENGRLNIEII